MGMRNKQALQGRISTTGGRFFRALAGFVPRRAGLGEAMNSTGAVEKSSLTGPVVAIASAGRPVWTARTYTALIRAGYLRNPIVYRAVRIVAEAAASTERRCSRRIAATRAIPRTT